MFQGPKMRREGSGRKLRGLREQQESINEDIKRQSAAKTDLVDLWANLKMNGLLVKYVVFLKTARTYLFSAGSC